jgi:hypothetical protein
LPIVKHSMLNIRVDPLGIPGLDTVGPYPSYSGMQSFLVSPAFIPKEPTSKPTIKRRWVALKV